MLVSLSPRRDWKLIPLLLFTRLPCFPQTAHQSLLRSQLHGQDHHDHGPGSYPSLHRSTRLAGPDRSLAFPLRLLQKKIVIYAKTDIEAGDEITYDYHFPIEQEKVRRSLFLLLIVSTDPRLPLL